VRGARRAAPAARASVPLRGTAARRAHAPTRRRGHGPTPRGTAAPAIGATRGGDSGPARTSLCDDRSEPVDDAEAVLAVGSERQFQGLEKGAEVLGAASLRPYQDHLAALIHEPCFRNAVGNAIFQKARVIKDLGNLAVHSHKPIKQFDALTAVRELFHVTFWLGRTYGRQAKPADELTFQQEKLPKGTAAAAETQEQLQALESKLHERDQKLADAVAAKAAADDELARLRAEVAKAKKANAAHPDDHDYSEAQTRDYFIDLLLREAG
jgi:hypothetical protein